MSNALTFQSTAFDVIDRDGQPWIQSRQLAKALGYKDEGSVNRIYDRNKGEFTESMVSEVNLTLPGNLPIQARIFSLRGCHLLAMFARTSVAKAFRVWVLDVLETLNKSQRAGRPALESSAPPVCYGSPEHIALELGALFAQASRLDSEIAEKTRDMENLLTRYAGLLYMQAVTAHGKGGFGHSGIYAVSAESIQAAAAAPIKRLRMASREIVTFVSIARYFAEAMSGR